MSNLEETNKKLQIVESPEHTEIKEEEPSTSGMSGDRPQKRAGRRPGRRSSKMDVRAKLERSRQSARECRARKKLRYQYLEDLVANREKAVFALRDELEMYKQWCIQTDSGLMPMALLRISEDKRIDEVKSKRQCLNDDILTYTATKQDIEMETESIDEEPDISDRFKGNNYSANSSTDGDIQFEDDESYDGDSVEKVTESNTDDLTWILEGDTLRVESRTKKSVFKGNNFVLPTIVEETEH